jgi:hypothetical protein
MLFLSSTNCNSGGQIWHYTAESQIHK